MQTKIITSELLKALQTIKPAIARRSTMPILSNVLIDFDGKDLKLTASDLDLAISVQVIGSGQKENIGQSITVNHKVFLDAIKTLGKIAEVTFSVDLEKSAIKLNNFTVIGVSALEYPSVTRKVENTLVASFLLRENYKQLKDCLHSVSLDESRFNLCGINFNAKENIFQSTDGHRLSIRKASPLYNELSQKLDHSSILPSRFIKAILKQKSGLLSIGSNGLAIFASDKIEISIRLIDGEFPDCSQILPKKGPTITARNINLAAFTGLLRQGVSVVTDKEKGIRLKLCPESNRLHVSSRSPTLGNFADFMNSLEVNGAIDLGINGQYLLEFLALQEKNSSIKLEFFGELGPIIIRGSSDNFEDITIVMPMRL